MKYLTLVFSSLIVISSCANKFETKRFDTQTWAPKGDGVEGVIYYEPQLMRIQYSFTALVDKEGKLLGSAEDMKCIKMIQKEEIQILPNFSEPRVLINKPSHFSSGKFSVSLSNGLLTAINSESSSELPALIKEITGGAGLVAWAALPGGNSPACNAAPKITGFNSIKPGDKF